MYDEAKKVFSAELARRFGRPFAVRAYSVILREWGDRTPRVKQLSFATKVGEEFWEFARVTAICSSKDQPVKKKFDELLGKRLENLLWMLDSASQPAPAMPPGTSDWIVDARCTLPILSTRRVSWKHGVYYDVDVHLPFHPARAINSKRSYFDARYVIMYLNFDALRPALMKEPGWTCPA